MGALPARAVDAVALVRWAAMLTHQPSRTSKGTSTQPDADMIISPRPTPPPFPNGGGCSRGTLQFGCAIADLMERSAGNLLPHNGENGLGPPAVALDDAFELRAAVRRHAQPIDDNVADSVRSILRSQTPINLDRLITTGPPDDLAGNDRSIRIGPAAGHTRAAAILGVIRQFSL